MNRGRQMGFFDKLFSKREKYPGNQLYAPMTGRAVALAEVPDPVFAEGMLGNGIAIIPNDGKVYAPCDATVSMMFDTGHAVSLTAENGAEILIHVGLETVNLQGKPFTLRARNGDKVRKGQLLLEANLEMIQAAGLPTITPVLICNTDDYTSFNFNTGNAVSNDDVVIELSK